jgi:hypothetical protein
MKSDQLRLREGHWHLSDKYANKDLEGLKRAAADTHLSEKARADAQSRLLAVLLLPELSPKITVALQVEVLE